MKNKRSFIGVVIIILLLTTATSFAQDAVQLNWITDLPRAEEVAAHYNELHPGITVSVEKITFENVFNQNQVRLGSGSSDPDIVSVDAPLVASYGHRGWLLPLDDAIPQEQQDNWVDALRESGVYDGKLLAPPIMNSTQLLYYNADLFAAAGITPPGPTDTWTWEQVTDAAQQLAQDTDGDGVIDIWGLQFEQANRPYQLLALPESMGAPAIGEDGLTVTGIIDSPEWVQAFTWLGDLHNTLNIAPKGRINAGDLFKNGQLAIFIGGPWNIPQMIATPPAFTWRAAPHPYFEGGEIAVPGDSWHIGVNPNGLHIPETIDFVTWLSSSDAGKFWYELDGAWPAHKDLLDAVLNAPENSDWPNRAFGVAASEGQYTVPRPLSVAYLEYEQLLADAIEDIRNGADVSESLTNAAGRIQTEMDKYRTTS